MKKKQIILQDGSVPALKFSNDSSGLMRVGHDEFVVSAGGAESIRFEPPPYDDEAWEAIKVLREYVCARPEHVGEERTLRHNAECTLAELERQLLEMEGVDP